MNVGDLIKYYANLLILQYIGKPRANATVKAQVAPVIMYQLSTQHVIVDGTPASGYYEVTYLEETVQIDWDDTVDEIQTKLRTLPGLAAITVVGVPFDYIVTFVNVYPPVELFQIESFLDSGIEVEVALEEPTETLPVAVQDGYNILGTPTALGKQLDVLGKYVGVSRSGLGFTSNITLNDADYLTLIKMAIAQNSLGSSLADIQNFIATYFPGQMLVTDYANMRMSYLLSNEIGSQDLIQLIVVQGLLPKPMGVQLSVLYTPEIDNFFGFVTYENPTNDLVSPFNTYENYEMDRPYMDYQYSV